MDQYTREVLQFYMTRDYGAVILYVMKNYNFQVQGFAPMERAVWILCLTIWHVCSLDQQLMKHLLLLSKTFGVLLGRPIVFLSDTGVIG